MKRKVGGKMEILRKNMEKRQKIEVIRKGGRQIGRMDDGIKQKGRGEGKKKTER